MKVPKDGEQQNKVHVGFFYCQILKTSVIYFYFIFQFFIHFIFFGNFSEQRGCCGMFYNMPCGIAKRRE